MSELIFGGASALLPLLLPMLCIFLGCVILALLLAWAGCLLLCRRKKE